MALHVLRDPRSNLLTVMAVALVIVVPLLFVFVTMMDRVFGPQSAIGWMLLWALLGIALVTVVVGMMVMLARSTQKEEWEHDDSTW